MLHIHRKSSVPLPEQIHRELSDRIRSGILESGSRLPSVRELARSLNVSLVTAVEAYRLLEQDGLAVRVHGKGTYVNGGVTRPAVGVHQAERETSFDWQLAISDYIPRAAVLEQHRGSASTVPYRMSTASLNPELSASTLPADLPTVLRSDPGAFSEYGPVEGMGMLRKEIAAYLQECGLRAAQEDTLVTSGVQQAIDLVARTFVGPGDVVVVEAPTYSGAIDVFRSRGATVISIPMDDEGIRVDLLTRQCDKTPPKLIYVMPTFQNPTGIVMSARRRAQLLDLAESYQSLILEDDSFSECSFVGASPPPIRSFDRHGHVIYVKGFSKVFCSGCRIAAMVASGSIMRRLIAAKSISDLGNPTITQILLHTYISHPDRRRRIETISRAVRRKRDIAVKVLETEAPAGVSWTIPNGGYNIWVTLPSSVNTDTLLISALQLGVSFLPGSACYAKETVVHQLRISYAYLPDEALREGVSRLCTLLTDTLRSSPESHVPII